SAGRRRAGGSLPPQCATVSRVALGALSAKLAPPPSPLQRADQVAGADALDRRSVCGATGRVASLCAGLLRSVLRPRAVGFALRPRRRWPAPHSSTPRPTRALNESHCYPCLCRLCYPCLCTVPGEGESFLLLRAFVISAGTGCSWRS